MYLGLVLGMQVLVVLVLVTIYTYLFPLFTALFSKCWRIHLQVFCVTYSFTTCHVMHTVCKMH